MKFNKILTVVLAGVSVLSAQSCLKDQADVFDSSSSERLQAYIEQTREILTSNEKGWIMEYYPGSGQSKGGYAYYLAFTDAEVTASYELDPENLQAYDGQWRRAFVRLLQSGSASLCHSIVNGVSG